jgi:Kelch motif
VLDRSIPVRRSRSLALLAAWFAVACSALVPQLALAAGSGSFASTGSLGTLRSGAGAALLGDGRVLVVAGTNGMDVLTTEAFNPQTGSFSSAGLPTLSTGRYNVAAARLQDGRVLIVGGNEGSASLQTTLFFDPQTNSFSSGPMLTVPRANAAAALLGDGRVLVAGGTNSTGFLNTAEVFNPQTNSFGPVGPMSSKRANPVAAPLPGGRVLVAGGRDDDPILSSAEIFDPGTNTFGSAGIGSMSTERVGAVAAPLPDGRVLIAGGGSATSSALASAEAFDPKTNAFSSAGIGSMGTVRTSAVAAPLPDGRVLVAGGQDGSSYLSSAEIFAATNTFSFRVKGKKLIVSVQASGKVSVADAASPLSASAGKKKRRLLLKPSSASGDPPTITVALRLSKLAKQRLRQKGKVKVRARITFAPLGGLANTQTAKLKIRSKRKTK